MLPVDGGHRQFFRNRIQTIRPASISNRMNAVYPTTGKRVRDLPTTPDKLI
jgi:hypothetical protein